MSDTSLYFSRSIYKTILLLTSSNRIRTFNIQKSRRGREVQIFLTVFEGLEAAHLPLASYHKMEDAIADMEEVSQALQLVLPEEGP